MEEILSNLLVPDSEVIKRATEELKAAFKRDDAIPQVNQRLLVFYCFAKWKFRKFRKMILIKKEIKANKTNVEKFIQFNCGR
jgi:hypothetical protein